MTTITYIDCGLVIDGHAEDPAACHGISAISQMVGTSCRKEAGAM